MTNINWMTVVSNRNIARDVYEMKVTGKGASLITAPGQFVNIKVSTLESQPYLRRPMSVCDYDSENLTMIYKVVGKGTKILRDKKNTSLTSIEINDYLDYTSVEDFENLQHTLNKLCQEGKIYYSEKKKRYLLLKNSHLIKGKLLMNPKGFGFVEIDKNTKDVYISEENIKDARNNDIVLIELINKSKERPEGKVIKIIKRDYTPLVGEVFIENDNYYVKTDGKGPDIYIPKEYINGAVEGHKVLVRPLKEGNYVGEILNVIGHKNDVGVDILSFVYEYGFRPNFPEEVIKEIEFNNNSEKSLINCIYHYEQNEYKNHEQIKINDNTYPSIGPEELAKYNPILNKINNHK